MKCQPATGRSGDSLGRPEHAGKFLGRYWGHMSKGREHGWALNGTIKSLTYNIIGLTGLLRGL